MDDELADKLANLDEDEDPEEIKQQYKEMSQDLEEIKEKEYGSI